MEPLKRRQTTRASVSSVDGRPIKRVLGYVRVSSETQVERGYSLHSQVEGIEEWCRRTLGEGNYILEIERDEGISGKYGWEPPKRGQGKYRPGLGRVVEKLRQGNVDYFVIFKLDRVFRNLEKQLVFLGEFFYEGSPCKLVALAESFDLDTLTGQMTAGMFGLMADFQRKQICQNVRFAMASRRRDGYPTGVIPYGWRRTPRENGRRSGLEPYPEELQWVQKAFELALKGWGTRKIAQELERQGAPPPGDRRGWSDQKVWRMLRQPIHAGLIWDGDETKPGVHWEQRIIEPEQFALVQRELEARKRDIAHHSSTGDKELQPLWRVARCGTCGTRLSVLDVDGVPAYRCRGSAAAGEVLPPEERISAVDEGSKAISANDAHSQPWSGGWCPGWTKTAAQADEAMLDVLARAVSLPEFQRLATLEAHALIMLEGREALASQRELLRRALGTSKEREQRLARLRVLDSISEEVYLEEHTRLQADRAETERELADVEARLADQRGEAALLARIRETLPQFPRIWQVLTSEERRLVVRDLTEYVLLERTGPRKARLRVKVHFLPEQVMDLHHSRSLAAGCGEGVAGLTHRELAVLCLYSEGHSLKEIAELWLANVSGLYQKGRRILQRLQVDTLEEAATLARWRIDKERANLPLDVSTPRKEWAPWRPSQLDRLAQVLDGHVRGLEGRAIAAEHGVTYTTVRNLEWKARRMYGVESLRQAVEHYRKLKEDGGDPFAVLQDPELRKRLRLSWNQPEDASCS